MKKGLILLSSFVGGAVAGAAVAMCVAPKKGKEMQNEAKAMIMEHVKQIKEHMQRCKCMMGEECDCAKDEMPKTEPKEMAM